jgi:molybdopterin-dependent oxidoreductase alpha subunit
LKAIMIRMLEKAKANPEILNHDFIRDETAGYTAFCSSLTSHKLDELILTCGVSAEVIEKAVELIAKSKRIIACWAMGLTQHKNAVDNIREVVNLLLLKGSIGKPGTGTCPVRGHSNVQGDRTMGINEKPSVEFLNNLKREFSFNPPTQKGFDTVETIQAMLDKRVNAFIALGGNFLSASPDTFKTEKALRNCELTVHISTKLNRSHLTRGKTSLILPCLGRTEQDIQHGKPQFVTVENSAGVVHQSKGNITPASPLLLSEPVIVSKIASAVLAHSAIDWNTITLDYDHIRNLIEKTIPGFDNYNERVRKPGGFYLPNAARNGQFNTVTQKANFTINRLSSNFLNDNEYLMMTIRSHDQYNTTIYGLNDRYRGIYNARKIVFMNPTDMDKNGFKKGDKVSIVSNYDQKERRAANFICVPYNIPTSNIATYFPEANAVIPYNHFADKSQTPISKSVIVKIEKV